MAEQQQYVSETGDAHHVRIESATLGEMVELGEAVELEEARKAQYGQRVAEVELYELERQHAEHVEYELARLDVVDGELFRLVHEQALLEVAGPELHHNVQQVDGVRNCVGDAPVHGVHHLQLLERLARDHEPQVVDDARAEHDQPEEHEVIVRTEDEVVETHQVVVEIHF